MKSIGRIGKALIACLVLASCAQEKSTPKEAKEPSQSRQCSLIDETKDTKTYQCLINGIDCIVTETALGQQIDCTPAVEPTPTPVSEEPEVQMPYQPPKQCSGWWGC